MSNLFINSLRAVPFVMQVVLDLLLVFKFRRAPYGGGRFWREAVQSVGLLTDRVSLEHPLLDQLHRELCRDVGYPSEVVEANPAILRKHFKAVKKMPIGSIACRFQAVSILLPCQLSFWPTPSLGRGHCSLLLYLPGCVYPTENRTLPPFSLPVLFHFPG